MRRELTQAQQVAMMEAFLARAGRPGLVNKTMGEGRGQVWAAEEGRADPIGVRCHPTENHIVARVDRYTGRIDVEFSLGFKMLTAGLPWTRSGMDQADRIHDLPEMVRMEAIARQIKVEMVPADPYADPRAGRSPEECENLGISWDTGVERGSM